MADLSAEHAAHAFSAHEDSFAREHLPPPELWPHIDMDVLQRLGYPPQLNCATDLLDRNAAVNGSRTAFVYPGGRWSYEELRATANRIANVLVEDLGMQPGNRVLLRGPNNPLMAACWFAVLKAGGICVSTMPLLRARELSYIIEKARVSIALTDVRFAAELEETRTAGGRVAMRAAAGGAAGTGADPLHHVLYFGTDGQAGTLEALMRERSDDFDNVATAADDVAIIAFTSGTTGTAKGTMHFHRDILAVADTFSRHVLKPQPDDLFCGSPPFAFTFGLGGLVLFPMRVGAAALLLEQAAPMLLLEAIRTFGATTCFTAPTAYRGMLQSATRDSIGRLHTCVSAGETLPRATFEAWEKRHRHPHHRRHRRHRTAAHLHLGGRRRHPTRRNGQGGAGLRGVRARRARAGRSRGGSVGRLAVRGPTGCRYLDDVERQRAYVQNGWNLTGDAYIEDEDGYFWYQARTDDMIISGGYNIAGPEVENVLLEHPDVKECAVIGVPDEERGFIVKAFVVLNDGVPADDTTISRLQDFVKAEIAPYKYPRGSRSWTRCRARRPASCSGSGCARRKRRERTRRYRAARARPRHHRAGRLAARVRLRARYGSARPRRLRCRSGGLGARDPAHRFGRLRGTGRAGAGQRAGRAAGRRRRARPCRTHDVVHH
jgi:2-aminobenzoate-CoA ligase